MLFAVTSSDACEACRPRSAVFSPKKVEIPLGISGLEVQDAVDGGGGRRDAHRSALVGGALVAQVLLAGHHPGQVVQERQLLAHERAVDGVLALDLAEQAAQL